MVLGFCTLSHTPLTSTTLASSRSPRGPGLPPARGLPFTRGTSCLGSEPQRGSPWMHPDRDTHMCSHAWTHTHTQPLCTHAGLVVCAHTVPLHVHTHTHTALFVHTRKTRSPCTHAHTHTFPVHSHTSTPDDRSTPNPQAIVKLSNILRQGAGQNHSLLRITDPDTPYPTPPHTHAVIVYAAVHLHTCTYFPLPSPPAWTWACPPLPAPWQQPLPPGA